MQTAVRRRPWCAWLILTVLLVLLLMPATGWIVAGQLRGTFLTYPWVIPALRSLGVKGDVRPGVRRMGCVCRDARSRGTIPERCRHPDGLCSVSGRCPHVGPYGW